MKLTAKIKDFSNGKSASGRVYDLDAMKRAIEEFNTSGNKNVWMNDDRETPCLGELGHPSSEFPINNPVGEVAGDIRFDNESAFADIELLNDIPSTKNAEAVKELLKSVRPSFVPRAIVREENELDADGNPILDENGEPKKIITHAEIVGVDILKQ